LLAAGRIFAFVLILMWLVLPELIICRFDLFHLTRRNEDRPLTDVGHAVRDALEVVRHP
jgi:hypothetical protein